MRPRPRESARPEVTRYVQTSYAPHSGLFCLHSGAGRTTSPDGPPSQPGRIRGGASRTREAVNKAKAVAEANRGAEGADLNDKVKREGASPAPYGRCSKWRK